MTDGTDQPIAAILAGGLGTRLSSVVRDRPKALAEVRGRPFLIYLLDQLADAGIRRAVLCTGHRGEQVEQLGDRYRGIRLVYSREHSPLGTAGALRLALSRVSSTLVLALNGDSYCSANLNDFQAWHGRSGFPGSILLNWQADSSRFGRVDVDPQGRVRRFEEKRPEAGPGWINAGVYILSADLIREIPQHRAVSLEREVLPAWLNRGIGGYCSRSGFLDIGLPESYAQAEQFFERESRTDQPDGGIQAAREAA